MTSSKLLLLLAVFFCLANLHVFTPKAQTGAVWRVEASVEDYDSTEGPAADAHDYDRRELYSDSESDDLTGQTQSDGDAHGSSGSSYTEGNIGKLGKVKRFDSASVKTYSLFDYHQKQDVTELNWFISFISRVYEPTLDQTTFKYNLYSGNTDQDVSFETILIGIRDCSPDRIVNINPPTFNTFFLDQMTQIEGMYMRPYVHLCLKRIVWHLPLS